jgi:DNA polymerase-3 subunit gamma/tau
MARILAKALNCTDLHDGEPCDVCEACVAIRDGRALDVAEFDAASNNTVGDMRDLLPRVFTAPSDLRRKVFIIDEVQRITQGWDVLLKTLEEPPDHAVFVFCTTDSSGIRPAVLSRVQRFDFRRMTVAEIGGKLRMILEGDGRMADPDAIDLIARLAAGGMRDAESMLDQLLATDAGSLTANRVREVLGLVEEETIERFLHALLSGRPIEGIDILDGLEERGRDLRAFTEQAIERLRAALVGSLGKGESDGLSAAGPGVLAAATRRLASIDPTHPGPGGLRLQLELALLAPPGATSSGAPVVQVMPERPAAVERTVTPPPAAPAPMEKRVPIVSTPASPTPERDPTPVAAAAQPSASAPAPQPAASRTRTGPTLQLLLERWAEIVEVVSKSPPTKPLILACRPVGVDGAVVTLGFPEGQSFFKDVAERRRSVLEDGVSRVLGIPVSVRCVAANVEVSPVAADQDGSRLMSEFRKIYGDDVVDVGEVD